MRFVAPLKSRGEAQSRIMEILSNAVQAVQQNVRALLLYLAIMVSANIVGYVANSLVIPDPEVNPFENPTLLIYTFGLDLFLILCAAFAQAIVFARFGKEIDRPLWKVKGDWEALRRYFGLWFALNAGVFVLLEATNWAGRQFDYDQPFPMFFILMSGASILYIPIGACIMFTMRFEWRNLGESLAPLRRQFPKALLILGINTFLFVFYLALMIQTQSQQWLWPAITAISGYFDCLIFSATWLLCMFDRANPEGVDLDF